MYSLENLKLRLVQLYKGLSGDKLVTCVELLHQYGMPKQKSCARLSSRNYDIPGHDEVMFGT